MSLSDYFSCQHLIIGLNVIILKGTSFEFFVNRLSVFVGLSLYVLIFEHEINSKKVRSLCAEV